MKPRVYIEHLRWQEASHEGATEVEEREFELAASAEGRSATDEPATGDRPCVCVDYYGLAASARREATRSARPAAGIRCNSKGRQVIHRRRPSNCSSSLRQLRSIRTRWWRRFWR